MPETLTRPSAARTLTPDFPSVTQSVQFAVLLLEEIAGNSQTPAARPLSVFASV